MLFNTPLTAAVLAALAGGPAASLATPLAKRDSCPTEYPQALGFPIRYNMTFGRTDSVSFQVPADATGCQLVLEFPAGYADVSHAGPSDEINIIDQKTGDIVASSVSVHASASEDTHVILAEVPCATLLSYTMTLPPSPDEESDTYWVAFNEQLNAGIVIEHDCTDSA